MYFYQFDNSPEIFQYHTVNYPLLQIAIKSWKLNSDQQLYVLKDRFSTPTTKPVDRKKALEIILKSTQLTNF
jgi:hypothetical protein